MINPKELELHKKLQPLYKRMMGGWLTGDRGMIIYRGEQTAFLVTDNYVEGLLAGTLCTITEEFGKVNFTNDDPALLRIPLTIDTENPERGLLWMLCPEGYVNLKEVYSNAWSCDGGGKEYFASTPTLAILKALAAQEGVE